MIYNIMIHAWPDKYDDGSNDLKHANKIANEIVYSYSDNMMMMAMVSVMTSVTMMLLSLYNFFCGNVTATLALGTAGAILFAWPFVSPARRGIRRRRAERMISDALRNVSFDIEFDAADNDFHAHCYRVIKRGAEVASYDNISEIINDYQYCYVRKLNDEIGEVLVLSDHMEDSMPQRWHHDVIDFIARALRNGVVGISTDPNMEITELRAERLKRHSDSRDVRIASLRDMIGRIDARSRELGLDWSDALKNISDSVTHVSTVYHDDESHNSLMRELDAITMKLSILDNELSRIDSDYKTASAVSDELDGVIERVRLIADANDDSSERIVAGSDATIAPSDDRIVDGDAAGDERIMIALPALS